MEKWDIYNENKERTGRFTYREQAELRDGEYHLVALIWLRRGNQYLIQKRSYQKESYPGVYAAHGGSVLFGETSLEGAIRETEEEIGVRVEHLKLFDSRIKDETIYDSYVADVDIELSDIVVDPLEVDSCIYATLDEIFEMMKTGTFYDYLTRFDMEFFHKLDGRI